MIEVNDGPRILKFEGRELGFSSSERPGADRWIEFTLYKTSGDGQYVLSRVGVSNLYHTPECRFTRRGYLPEVPRAEGEKDRVACGECRPDRAEFPLVCPEVDKTWARVYKTPEALLKGLLKPDRDGGLYLTSVARRLIEDASESDRELAGAYQVETVT
jgi:hypothetical protein